MTQIGQRVQALLPAAAIGAIAALVGVAAMWGYTVDDAWISLRYARHIATGAGYRFNASGPMTDGVTPLPWPFLIAPWASLSASHALLVTQCIGVMLTAVAAMIHSSAVYRITPLDPFSKRLFAIVPALSLPVAAYAVSGMDTPLAVFLCALSAVLMDRPMKVAIVGGLAATIRPELVPWAATLACGAALAKREPLARLALTLAVALLPFALESAVRAVVFGSVAPLAVRAKPSDFTHGALYALAGMFLVGVFPLVVAPRALLEKRGPALAIVVATLAHCASVIVVGGDWMSYARLFAPIVFPLAYAGARLAQGEAKWVARSRLGLSVAICVYTLFAIGRDGAEVNRDRARLIESARPYLANTKTVAALDVGWVSAATDATIVDLAGLTDPEIAALPGGHTSKRIDPSMLFARGVDTVLIYGARDSALPGRRVVEARLASSALFLAHFEEVQFLPLGRRGMGYTVFKKKE